MDTFFPFIHKIDKKKKDNDLQLYIEIEPPPIEQIVEKKEEESKIIIEL